MFPIPWYVTVFQSIPEGFLIIFLSLKLMKEKELAYSKIIIMSIIYGLVAYAVRNMNAYVYNTFPPYLHTVLLIICIEFIYLL